MAETPLLDNLSIPQAEKTVLQLIISQTFKSLANLTNLLPTCTVLTFQILLPVLSYMGSCGEINRYLTTGLIVLCAIFCFLQSFTDSFMDEKGNVLHGFATLNGLWILDGSTTLPPQVADQYKLRFIDFLHAIMSVMVFSAIAFFNQDVVNCFFPEPSSTAEQFLAIIPVAIGAVGSVLFVIFPTTRHGIGNPITATAA